MQPEPVPTEDYVDGLWKAVNARVITWKELDQLQAESMPKCAPHGKPANIKIGGVPVCVQCLQERGHER